MPAEPARRLETPSESARPLRLPLQLVVADPEVIEEVLQRAAGKERDEFALAALRLGVLAMRTARGEVDAAAVRKAGTDLIREMSEVLDRAAGGLTASVREHLTAYFDPSTGALTQRLDDLVRDGGGLARFLQSHVGADSSTLARTLAQHLGANSPLFRLLDPEEASGLRARIESTVATVLDEYRGAMLAQFSLDVKDSALSRLVAEIAAKQAALSGDLKGQVDTVVAEFSLDNPQGALTRLVQRVEATREEVGRHLTLDDEKSALSRLQARLTDTLEKLRKENTEFHGEVRATLAALQARRQESERGTRHGTTFEEQFGAVLLEEAQRVGDSYDAVGNKPGSLNRKVGDHVVQLGAESRAAGARVVFETKADRSYSVQEARDELAIARSNRGAQVGVFVFAKRIAPSGLAPFARYDDDLIVVWDEADPATDIYWRAAYSVARAMVVRQASNSTELATALAAIEEGARWIQKQLVLLEEIETKATTVQGHGKKIGEAAAGIRQVLAAQVERLDTQVASLRADPH